MSEYPIIPVNDNAVIHVKFFDDGEMELELVDDEGDNLAVYLEPEHCKDLIDALKLVLDHQNTKKRDLENKSDIE